MGELLVIFACLNNTGCSETSSQYYSQNPTFQEFVRREETRIKEVLGPTVIQYYAPIIGLALGREATARLSSRFYLTFKSEHSVLIFKQEF